MGTVSPEATWMRTRRPSNGEGISALTLSVTTSTMGSSRRTMSPSCFSQRSTVPSVTDSPSCGIFSVARLILLPPRIVYDFGQGGGPVQGRRRMARRFRVGICTDQNMPWDKTVERWQLFERLGFESAWLCDHLVQPSRPNGPYFEAWSLLAGLAARTEKIGVGVLVTSNTFRYPQVLAKMAVTVDHISNGRLELGLGAGWYEPEHTMFGIAFPETKELVSRFREAVQVVDLMTREDTSSFDGTYYQLRGVRSRPASVQKPRPPLVLGAQDRRRPVGFQRRVLRGHQPLHRGRGQPVHPRSAARRPARHAGLGGRRRPASACSRETPHCRTGCCRED